MSIFCYSGWGWSHGRSPPRRGSPRGAWPSIGISRNGIEKQGQGAAPLGCLRPSGEDWGPLIISTGKNQNDSLSSSPPHTPIRRGAAAPKGARGGGLNCRFPGAALAPPCRGAALRRGTLIVFGFHRSGVNDRSGPFHQNNSFYLAVCPLIQMDRKRFRIFSV